MYNLLDASTVVAVLIKDPNGGDALIYESSATDDSSFFSLSPDALDYIFCCDV